MIEPPKTMQERINDRVLVARAEQERQNKMENSAIRKSIIPSAVTAGLDFIGNSILQDKAQHYYKENQRELFKLQQQAQRDAPSNEVEGLRKAGLSPLFAQGASGMSIAGASSPQASTHAPAPAPEFGKLGAERSLMAREESSIQKDIEVKNAQAGLLQSQKLAQDIENENAIGANYLVAQMWDKQMDLFINDAVARGDSVLADSLTAVRDSAHPIQNSGGYDMLVAILGSGSTLAESELLRVRTYLDDVVLNKQIASDTILNSYAIAPFLKSEKFKAEITELGVMCGKLIADTRNAEALLPAYQKKVDEVLAEIRRMNVQADEIHNSDLQTAVVNDDWGRVSSIVTEDAVKMAFNALSIYGAVRAGRGAGVLGKVAGTSAVPESVPVVVPKGRRSPSRPTSPSNPHVSTMSQEFKNAVAPYRNTRFHGEHIDYPKRKPPTIQELKAMGRLP